MSDGCLFFWGKVDPGPCPVDDTPHTACTPESVAAQRARGGCVAPAPVPQLFSTASYPRPLHEKPATGLLTTARMVRMRASVDALQAGQVYYMRPVQADRYLAQGVAEIVVEPTPPPPVVPASSAAARTPPATERRRHRAPSARDDDSATRRPRSRR